MTTRFRASNFVRLFCAGSLIEHFEDERLCGVDWVARNGFLVISGLHAASSFGKGVRCRCRGRMLASREYASCIAVKILPTSFDDELEQDGAFHPAVSSVSTACTRHIAGVTELQACASLLRVWMVPFLTGLWTLQRQGKRCDFSFHQIVGPMTQ